MALPRAARITSVEALDARRGNLARCVVVGLELREHRFDARVLEHTVFLGCALRPEIESDLRARGALVVPRLSGLPFDPMRTRLYAPEELLQGYDGALETTYDYGVYAYFVERGRFHPDVYDALAQRLHDFAIDEALRDFLAGRTRVVAVMGGHGKRRDSTDYARVARLAWKLARAGHLVASGGGPGIMEAANLGAWLSRWDDPGAVDAALAELARAPVFHVGGPELGRYVDAARAVRDRFPGGAESLAVPTWFYGHEPSNLFGTHVAKYFSNGLREDTLLAIAAGGVVFAAGSAGTTQEIFMDAAQNHYETYGAASPMVFLGRERYERETNLFETVRRLAAGRAYEELLLLTDEIDEVVSFLSR